MRKILITSVLCIFLTGCGFEPLYKNINTQNLKINYEIIETNGNDEINKYIVNSLNRYLDLKSNKIYEININTKYVKSGIANNKKKETTAYLLEIVTEFQIKNKSKNHKITIKEDIKINKLSNNFNQQNYEIKIKKEISKSIVNKFINNLFSINDN